MSLVQTKSTYVMRDLVQGLPKRPTETHSGIKRDSQSQRSLRMNKKLHKYFHLKIPFHSLFYDFGCTTLACIFYFCLRSTKPEMESMDFSISL